MSEEKLCMHYVCTPQEARELIAKHERFWVSNCGCRESGEGCRQSRMDVCLYFNYAGWSSGSGAREVDRAEVESILREAAGKQLVTRPFRNEDFTDTDGICFCCQDCCYYFKNGEEKCNKGKFIEQTEMADCINCGACTMVCYFNARHMQDGRLEVKRENCYGCGLCPRVCPTECISMVER